MHIDKLSLEDQFLSTEGRLNRKPFVLYTLAVALFGLCLLIPSLIALVFMNTDDFSISILNTIVSSLFDLALLPGICLIAKRLHDLNKSAVFSVLAVIPFVNLILLIYLLFAKGTKGTNKYGRDLLSSDAAYEIIAYDEQNLNVSFWTKLERQYFSTKGCLKRKPFAKYIGCLFGLFITLIVLVLIVSFVSTIDVINVLINQQYPQLQIMQIMVLVICALFVAICALPLYFMSIRRLHDLNFSGWWIVIPQLIPAIWLVYIILLCCLPSRKTNNKYNI